MFKARNCVWLAVTLLAAAATCPAWAADEKQAPTEKPKVVQSEAKNPAADNAVKEEPAGEKAEEFVVPEGTPKELVAYITKLVSAPPSNREAVKKVRKAVLQAAEKILAAKPDDTQMEFAAQWKMRMLDKPEQLVDFIAELHKSGHEKLARQGRGFMLQIDLRSVIAEGRGDLKKAIAEAVRFLEEAPPQPADISLAYETGIMAEMSGDKELATRTYARLTKVFSASKDAKVAEFAKTLEGVVRRLSIAGQEMKIEGTTLGGGTFDWSKYLGKVVLVDFWATWCAPCIQDLPDLRGCYELYHGKGFDVVGISLDRKVADVESFVKERGIPWTIVVGGDKPSPAVTYYGVMSIPATFLVGKDGKVVAMNVTGEALRAQLEKLLGPAEEKKTEKTSKKAADGK